MEFEILLQNGNTALLSAKDQYIVAIGFQGSEWSYGDHYMHWERAEKKAAKLSAALDAYRGLVEDEYVSYARLQELASKFVAVLMLDDEVSVEEYFLDNCLATRSEQKLLGIDCRHYTVAASKLFSEDDEEIILPYHTGSPRKAVEKWFELDRAHPMCIAIIAKNKYAQELLEWSVEHEADIQKMHEVGCHYKWDYFIEAIKYHAKSVEDENSEDYDMVYPFCIG